ncbi:hypothetical protein BWD42_03455 [Sphingobacterium sp. CZ-UAM]|uniref:DUF6766 family protein n=1 Tax=Sphingobacterium sp. CZ-UAM TaxID=1933868 RepID=UPI000986404B|nr:DUF6766 family protein [Sphingobacterium sp. CZ-UAM]OOG19021.1 hypothetical protein BWD42_03455 [Sphingobacterium sp. CZ-UAM]
MKTKDSYSFLYRNGLSLVFLILFIFALGMQFVTGWKVHNEELQQAQQAPLTLVSYLRTGHFISATFENFESEFLQMALYVMLTVGLRQWGSAESKKLDEPEEVDREPKPGPDAPYPVRKGGWLLRIYSSSLFICFALLFLISWVVHFYGSWRQHNMEQILDGLPPDAVWTYLLMPQFWFETFQNWQSEFLSVLSIVFFTIFLRQKGSPESKPVDAPHAQTGKN